MATIVLIHGAMHGAWCWHKTIPYLKRAGHEVIALDLPAHGRNFWGGALPDLKDCVDYVVQALADEDQIVLVGHSLGGTVISAVAERMPEKIARLVYVCAIVPSNGQSAAEAAAVDGVSAMSDNVLVDAEAGLMFVHLTAIRDAFFHDCADEDVELAALLLGPEPLVCISEPLRTSPSRFGAIPKAYVRCDADRALPPEVQDRFVDNIGIEDVRSLPSGHSPFFSMPGVLAELIDDWSRPV